jgi:hydrogenase maturation protease
MNERRAPVLVLAVGNPSRGDDALGPLLAERLEAAALPGVEVITEFQLQVENALDLEGRERVIFVDAGVGTDAPFELREPRKSVPGTDFQYTTHALSPEAVLATYMRIKGEAPPLATILCVRGESFELGAGLSHDAAAHLEAAWPALDRLCAAGLNRVPAPSPGSRPAAPSSSRDTPLAAG